MGDDDGLPGPYATQANLWRRATQPAAVTRPDRPAISVGIPFYNASRTLAQAVGSVLNQDFQDWELLLVDDGSTDGGLEMLPRPLDPRIRVISDGKNMGLVARLNQIAQLAGAPYLARMDADDIMHPERLSKQLEHLVEHPELDLVASGAWIIDDDDRVYAKRYDYPLSTDPRSVFRQDFILHPTVTARTGWFLAHPYDPAFPRGEDKELWCRTWHVSRFARLPDPLLFFVPAVTSRWRVIEWGAAPTGRSSSTTHRN